MDANLLCHRIASYSGSSTLLSSLGMNSPSVFASSFPWMCCDARESAMLGALRCGARDAGYSGMNKSLRIPRFHVSTRKLLL